MVALLKGLLGKTHRPIVINGRLLCTGRSPVLASLVNYRVVFSVLGSNEELPTTVGENLIAAELEGFRAGFDEILVNTGIAYDNYEACVDTYTGAVIIESPAYKMLADEEMHTITYQHDPVTSRLLRQFIVRYTEDYFDNYIYLFNRRIAAQHMPINIRGHFVAGLFQPLVVGTKLIPSPLRYSENSWFRDILGGYEVVLEKANDSPRKLELSCVAMCDIANAFRTPVIFELDRKVFMLMVELILLSQLDKDRSAELTKKYNHLFRKALINPEQESYEDGRLLTDAQRVDAIHHNNAQLFTAMMDYAAKSRISLRTV